MAQDISVWQAAALGLVQGLTEFIPVSSSAHLNFFHTAFNQDRKLAFDVLLSLGTTVALGYYFRHDWKELLTNPLQRKLRNMVVVASVPAVLMAFPLHKLQDQPPFDKAYFEAGLLAAAGILMYVADRAGRKERLLESVNATDATIIGIAQGLALFPGVSRSGGTLTAGLFRGMTRDAAARFSFLMSLPISIGALLFEFYKDVLKSPEGWSSLHASVPAMVVGVVLSGVSGFWAIDFLLKFLRTRSVAPFTIYRIIAALVVWTMLKPASEQPEAGAQPKTPAATRTTKPTSTRPTQPEQR